MTRFKSVFTGFNLWIILLLVDFVVVTGLFFAGYQSVAWFVGSFGTLMLGLVMLFYIVFIDSKKRSPDLPWYRRVNFIFSYTPLPQHRRMLK